MIEFEKEAEEQRKEPHCSVSIKVLGVGGAGGNTVNSIIESGYRATEFIVANADAQALELSRAKTKVQIGVKSTKGLGTGADPEVGKRAAEEDLEKVMEAIGDADIVFLAGGMGGKVKCVLAKIGAGAVRRFSGCGDFESDHTFVCGDDV